MHPLVYCSKVKSEICNSDTSIHCFVLTYPSDGLAYFCEHIVRYDVIIYKNQIAINETVIGGFHYSTSMKDKYPKIPIKNLLKLYFKAENFEGEKEYSPIDFIHALECSADDIDWGMYDINWDLVSKSEK